MSIFDFCEKKKISKEKDFKNLQITEFFSANAAKRPMPVERSP
jgi:hypothetical protein